MAAALVERTHVLDAGPSGSLTLVLDATVGSGDYRDRVAELVRSVIARGAALVERLYFLGASANVIAGRELRPDTLEIDLRRWYKEHSRTVRLLRPIMDAERALSPGGGRAEKGGGFRGGHDAAALRMVVLHHGPIRDLADFGASRQDGRLILLDLREDDAPARLGPVLDRLQRRARTLELTGDHWMPIWWDNPRFVYEWGGGKGRLIGRLPDGADGDLSLSVRSLTGDARAPAGHGTPHARAFWSDESDPSPVAVREDAGMPVPESAVWNTLPPSEMEILRAIRRGEQFTCPHDPTHEHEPHEAVCREKGTRLVLGGRPIRPPLEAAPGLVLIQDERVRVRYRTVEHNVTRLSGEAVVVAAEGTLRQLVYDAGASAWIDVGELTEPYVQKDERCLVTAR